MPLFNSMTALLDNKKSQNLVFGSYQTQVLTSSTTLTDTGLAASISPTSNKSKILIFLQQNGCGNYGSWNNHMSQLVLFRDETSLCNFDSSAGYVHGSLFNAIGSIGGIYLDTPNQTNLITYKTKFAANTSDGPVAVQWGNCVSTILLMEILE